jgi:hypothetical protein
MVASGQWTRDKIRALAELHDVTWQQIYVDRAHVIESITEALIDPDPTRAKVDLLMRARKLYQTCAEVRENRSTAAKLLDFEARVVGAYEPIKVQLTTATMPDEELARAILDPEAIEWARSVLGEQAPPLQIVDAEWEPAPIVVEPDK